MKGKNMIVGLVAMYMPQPDEIGNISKYIGELDYCYLLDDSAQDNSSVVQTLLDEHPGIVQYYMNPYNMGLEAGVKLKKQCSKLLCKGEKTSPSLQFYKAIVASGKLKRNKIFTVKG